MNGRMLVEQQSIAHQARLLAALHAPILELDERLVVVFRTNAFFRFDVGDPLIPQLPEAARESAQKALLQTLADGKRSTFAMRYRARHFRTEVSRVDNPAGPSLCLLGSDVTEEVTARLQRERERQRLEVALEASRMGLWSWNLRSDTVTWDRRMRQIMGCDTPFSLGEWKDRLGHPDDGAAFDEILRATRCPGPLPSKPVRILLPDGQVRWILTFGRVTPDDRGAAELVMGGTLDVTEPQLLAERLRAAQRMEALGHLTAGVAHNFNNMLMVITPSLAQIRAQVAPELRQDVMDAINAAQRASDVVRDLMTFAGQQNRKDKEVMSVTSICLQGCRLCRRSFPQHLELHTSFEAKGRVECVPGSIEQVLGNLLINARDALTMPATEQPWISVETRDVTRFGQPWVEIAVSDNGPGIPETLRERVFEPFVTTKAGKGTGLGLASSQALVEQHGGRLVCEPRTEGGTIFFVLLPAHRADRSDFRVHPPRPPASARRGRVLIVDDEPAIRRLVSRGLRHVGFWVESVDGKEDAEELIRTGAEFDLVLLDRTLQRGHGADLLPLFRTQIPRAKILYFTGEPVADPERDEVEGVVQKPVSIVDLVSTIEAVLSVVDQPETVAHSSRR